ncbi:PREDICTED: modifier of mdg4-like [Papilio polytes]|uniref:modifier of mdg4-like n=1 Tax=Papilio polytes TaxID=76194 RepID=UPI0006765536|nr:PREDICTED: modifier of mdg4-like [Papilio polytes]
MAPIRYSLHYEDYSEHLMSRFGKLLQMQSLVDMTLMCSSHTLRVHKAVLAASSAYFQELLQKQSGEPLIILKMRFSVLKSLVEFMYCGKTQCLEENLDELVSAAQFLKIKGLSKVTKEGLGITKHTELPVFTPPVVISRPPQSLINLHAQEPMEAKPPPAPLAPASTCQSNDSLNRTNKDMVVRIPFDIENGGGGSAGLPTDLPILFESGDGSYINVNEQVLLDMVQSNEIQYEVIEQPNIIEKVADPSEIKSIDDLSKSIERGEMLINSKGYNDSNYDKDPQYSRHEDAINSLSAILPDNLESFGEQQNYVVLGQDLQESQSNLDPVNSHDFSCIDSDMQFFYDFSLPLPQSSDFKEDPLDCLISSSKQNDDVRNNFNDHDELDKRVQERDDLIKDLMNIEEKIKLDNRTDKKETSTMNNDFNVEEVFQKDVCELNQTEYTSTATTKDSGQSNLQWDNVTVSENVLEKDCDTENVSNKSNNLHSDDKNKSVTYSDPIIDLTERIDSSNQWDDILQENEVNKENMEPCSNHDNSTLEGDIPFAVGLLPLKQVQTADDEVLLKRKVANDSDSLDTVDAKCLKRKIKHKKL